MLGFVHKLHKKPIAHQILWLHILGSLEQGRYEVLSAYLLAKFKVPKPTLHRIIVWGINELGQDGFEISYSWRSNLIIFTTELKVSEPKPEPQKVVKKRQPKVPKVELIDPTQEIIEEVINFLNECTGKRYSSTAVNAKKYITLRLSEGFILGDFKRVIEVKSKKWMGSKMEDYLRPETLFGSKFETYLNESPLNNEQQRRFNSTQRAVDEAKQFDFFGNSVPE
jgi:uncharacterized phage protein (TIGR02220 family)